MFTMDITDEERSILIELLQSCLSDLKTEILRSEGHDYKEYLKARRAVLMRLYNELLAQANVPAM